MTARKDLPAELDGVPFRVARALESGVSRQRLDRADLTAPFRGIRMPADSGSREVCRALSLAFLPGTAFSGTTAAWLWGLPLPAAMSTGLVVSTLSPRRALRISGVVGMQRTHGSVVELDGIPVLDPETTFITLGRELSVADLTAAADRLVSGTLRRPPLSSPGRLAAALELHSGARHIRELRAAVQAARSPVWSRPETLLRLLVVAAGLPEPVPNLELELLAGTAILDLAWPGQKFGLEYDGEWHNRSRQQWARDSARREAIIDVGWLTMHVRAGELFGDGRTLLRQLTRRLASRGLDVPSSLDLTRLPRFAP